MKALNPNSILKNTGFLLVGNVIQKILSFFIVILIVRYLGPQKYGQFTLIISLVGIMEIVWNFGLSVVFVRDVSRDLKLASIYAGDIIITRIVLFVIIIPIIFLYLYFWGYDSAVISAAAIFVLGRLFMSINNIYESIFAAFKLFQYKSIINVIYSFALLIAIYIVTKISGGVLEVFGGYFFSFLLSFIIATIIIHKKFFKPSFHFKLSILKKYLRMGIPFLLTNFSYILFNKIDHLMISIIKNDTELGYYGSAYTLFEIIITFLPLTIINVSFPVLSEYYEKNLEKMKSLLKILLKLFLFLGIPISSGFILLGPQIIFALYGSEYNESGTILSVLGGSISIFFIVTLLSWTLTAANRQKEVLISIFIAMVINILTNLYFIPRWGALGAAWTTLISELILGILVGWVLFKHVNIPLEFNFKKILVGSLVMSIFVLEAQKYKIFSNSIFQLIWIIFGASFLYFLVAYLLKTISMSELKILSHNEIH